LITPVSRILRSRKSSTSIVTVVSDILNLYNGECPIFLPLHRYLLTSTAVQIRIN
jgi:hypothetical protein